MCCCLVQSCCCGWQTLEHGLFIFAVFDIFLNLVMVCCSIVASNTGIASLNGLLILADVGLAFGAKHGVINSGCPTLDDSGTKLRTGAQYYETACEKVLPRVQ
jgi:hypothetical protein